MKTVILILMMLVVVITMKAESNPEVVYIAKATCARAYHYNSMCPILLGAKEIEQISRDKAKELGRIPCHRCLDTRVRHKREEIYLIENPSVKPEDLTENQISSKYYKSKNNTKDPFIHSFRDCAKFDTTSGYDQIDLPKNDDLLFCSTCEQLTAVNRGEKSDSTFKLNELLVVVIVIGILSLYLIYFLHKTKTPPHITNDNSNSSASTAVERCSSLVERQDTKTISLFLQKFGTDPVLKYTTHSWDMGERPNYHEFKRNIKNKLNEHENKIKVLCPHLWDTIINFLNPSGYKKWGNKGIQVGYNDVVASWMHDNTEEEPGKIPLHFFPEEYRPTIVDGRTLDDFSDVIRIFKRQIEFRDNDLFAMFLKFEQGFKTLRFCRNDLNLLKGRRFYTDTQKVRDAICCILNNMKDRSDRSNNIAINCKVGESNEEREELILEITHQDSFAETSINDPITFWAVEGKQSYKIKQYVRNLCDLSIESMFREPLSEELKPYRINLLSSNTCPSYEEIKNSSCDGYKVILKFYTYKI